MENTINWQILVPVLIGALILIAYLVIRNMKDEKDFEQSENEIFPKNGNEDTY